MAILSSRDTVTKDETAEADPTVMGKAQVDERLAARRRLEARTAAATRAASTTTTMPAVAADTTVGPRSRASLVATLSVMLGVAAALTVLTGVLAGPGIALGLLAAVFGVGGVSATSRRHVAGKGHALLGIALGLGAVVIGSLALTGTLPWLSADTDQVARVHEWLEARLPDAPEFLIYDLGTAHR